MKRFVRKIMTLICSSAFIIAVTTVNSVSRGKIYQGEFPKELMKYKREHI